MKKQLSDYKLNGKVKNYYLLKKKIDDNNEMLILNKTYILFNENGFVIEKDEPNSGDSMNRKISYTYDEYGNITEKYLHNSDRSDYAKQLYDDSVWENVSKNFKNINEKPYAFFSYKYDSNNNLIEECTYLLNISLRKTVNKFDSIGNKIEIISVSSNDVVKSIEKYKYDVKNNMIELLLYDSDSNLTNKTTWKYDNEGNITENIDYKTDGSIFLKINKKYNKKGEVKEEIKYGSDGNINYLNINKYDALGREISSYISYPSQNTGNNTIYKYDENGFKIKELTIDKDGNYKTIKKWQYDNQGNILEKVTFYPDINMLLKNILKYDKWNNKIEEIRYNKDAVINTVWAKEYDVKGRIIMSSNKTLNSFFKSNGKSKYSTSNKYFKYDKLDNVIEETITFYNDTKLLSKEISNFVFDDNNNLIYKTVVKDDVIIEIIEISINYFE